MSNKIMNLNHETAMRLWGKTFGKQTKAIDFAGREIAKGAYNDRNSQFGWNVDHILPQSKGGITADHNLICCNIQTNDEKADKFPCFYANGTRFEIIKVQNHYEIKTTGEKNIKVNHNECINFYDSAAGIRLFTKKSNQDEERFVGYVLISLQNLREPAVIDFIKELFNDEIISSPITDYNYRSPRYQSDRINLLAVNYNLPNQEDVKNLLDKCILLNTYLSKYFLNLNYINSYEIHYSMVYCKSKIDMYKSYNGFDLLQYQLKNTLYINSLVVKNTEAKNTINIHTEFVEYNYIYDELSKNLLKEVERN